MIPRMDDVIAGFGKKVRLAVISKSVSNFETTETVTQMRYVYGVFLPIPDRKLELRPEGEYQWMNRTLYSSDTTLKIDDMLQDDDGFQYRVTDYADWRIAGFREYSLQQVPMMGSAGNNDGVGQAVSP